VNILIKVRILLNISNNKYIIGMEANSEKKKESKLVGFRV
jgi:hypothetical protein